jgi:uncharacterized Fe-S cluster protein YjdI
VAEKKYRGAQITVTYDAEICQHAAECVRGLPDVFDVRQRPWIHPDNAAPERVAEVIGLCPSGALKCRFAPESDL